MSATNRRRGWCVQVRRSNLEVWRLAPLDRSDADYVFRSEAEATEYAESALGPNGVNAEWKVVPFAFFSGDESEVT